jgi:hypothetical protein
MYHVSGDFVQRGFVALAKGVAELGHWFTVHFGLTLQMSYRRGETNNANLASPLTKRRRLVAVSSHLACWH